MRLSRFRIVMLASLSALVSAVGAQTSAAGIHTLNGRGGVPSHEQQEFHD
jgi:hypothetical protein